MTPQLGDPGKAAELLAQILAMEHVSKFDFSILYWDETYVPPIRRPVYQWLAVGRGERYGDKLEVSPGSDVTPAQSAVMLLRIAVHTLKKLA